MYWQRYKVIFQKKKRSTPQISMFWLSYGLGTIRFGFLDLKNGRLIYHPWGSFSTVQYLCTQYIFVHN